MNKGGKFVVVVVVVVTTVVRVAGAKENWPRVSEDVGRRAAVSRPSSGGHVGAGFGIVVDDA